MAEIVLDGVSHRIPDGDARRFLSDRHKLFTLDQALAYLDINRTQLDQFLCDGNLPNRGTEEKPLFDAASLSDLRFRLLDSEQALSALSSEAQKFGLYDVTPDQLES